MTLPSLAAASLLSLAAASATAQTSLAVYGGYRGGGNGDDEVWMRLDMGADTVSCGDGDDIVYLIAPSGTVTGDTFDASCESVDYRTKEPAGWPY